MKNSPVGEKESRAVPRHIAIVMDGNGRWAREKGLSRTEGHREGAKRVKEIARKCIELGVEYLTIYAFSKENWKRPKAEVSAIMKLTDIFYKLEFRDLRDDGVYFVHLGDRTGLPKSVIKVLDNIERDNTDSVRQTLTLNIAFNYSGRAEITHAFHSLSEKLLKGDMQSGDITEEQISRHLYTADIPDPDLFIRTGGEMRVSNFLLWQIAYSEIWVTDVLWPDFTAEVLQRAVDDFASRERRFGGL